MNNLFFLAADVSSYMNNGMSLSEKAADSAAMVVRGMGMVFTVLILLWLALSLFRVFFYDIPNKRKKKEAAPTEAAPAETETAPESVPETAETAADDTELVAVIAAAVSAYTDKPVTSFRVVSFKRAGKGNEWNKFSR